MPAEARLARRGGEPCAVPFRGPTGGLRTARPALRAPRLPRTARGVRAHGRDCRRVAARASPPAIAPNATQRFRQVFRSAAIDPAPAASVPTGVPGVAESRYDFHAAPILAQTLKRRGARMDVLIGVIITFL